MACVEFVSTRRIQTYHLLPSVLEEGIVNKLLHGPMTHIRKTESIEGKQNSLKELSAMFPGLVTAYF